MELVPSRILTPLLQNVSAAESLGSSVAPDGRHQRQRGCGPGHWQVPRDSGDPKPLLVLVGMAVIAYTFAGFFVYWLITGSGTVGIGGRVSDLGSFIWAGPLFAWLTVYLTGRRGPFADCE